MYHGDGDTPSEFLQVAAYLSQDLSEKKNILHSCDMNPLFNCINTQHQNIFILFTSTLILVDAMIRVESCAVK